MLVPRPGLEREKTGGPFVFFILDRPVSPGLFFLWASLNAFLSGGGTGAAEKEKVPARAVALVLPVALAFSGDHLCLSGG